MSFEYLITKLTQAACSGNGKAAGKCFTEDGIYHDCFYGSFQGRDNIADMIENYFHRDAEDFIWDIHNPVSDSNTGYARYVFSYTSKIPGCEGKRGLFEGVSVCSLKDGLINEYHEVADAATGLHLIGFSGERIAKHVGHEAKKLATRDESLHHKAVVE